MTVRAMPSPAETRAGNTAPWLRAACLAAMLAASVLLFWAPLHTLFIFSFQYEYNSYIVLIPLLTLALLLWERRKVVLQAKSSPYWAVILMCGAAVGGWAANRFAYRLGENDYLSLAVFAFVLLVWGGFALCYGGAALRQAYFPLLFLLLMVPVPQFFLTKLVTGLQYASAEMTSWLFHLSGVPVFRDGLNFTLPGVRIQVAPQCSGIRSTMALFVLSVLAGHLFLHSLRKQFVLMAALLPVVVFKNAVRIATLTLLSVYVDPGFLKGSLHNEGGILFFVLGMVLLAPLFLWLRRQPVNPKDAAHAGPTRVPMVVGRAGVPAPRNT